MDKFIKDNPFWTDTEIASDSNGNQTPPKVDKSATILCVDAEKRIGRGESIETAIDSVMEFIKGKILGSPSDFLSLVFYNSKSNNDYDFKGIFLLNDLSPPSISMIKQLKRIKDTFKKNGMSANNETSFYDLLLFCQFILREKKNFRRKEIFIFTDNEHPNENDLGILAQSKLKFQDLVSDGVEMEIFPITKYPFDFKVFYQAVLTREDTESKNEDRIKYCVCFNTNTKESLKERVSKKLYRKRAIARLYLSIKEELEISVEIYSLVSRFKRVPSVFLDAETNSLLKSKTVYQDTKGTEADKEEIETCFSFGNIPIPLNSAEKKEILDFGTQKMELLGFVPEDDFDPKMNIRSPYFIYPTDERVKGSSLFFVALIKALKRLKKHGIAKVYLRKLKYPRYVRLVPQLEEKDRNNFIAKPPGLHMIFIPYADDIRDIEIPLPNASDKPLKSEEINLANKLVDNLTINLGLNDILRVKNPDLSRFYNVLEAHALEEELEGNGETEKIEQSFPEVKKLKKSEKFIEAEKGMVEYIEKIESERSKISSTLKKRKNGGRFLSDILPPEDVDFAYLEREGKLNKCTVGQLKEFLGRAGLSKVGKKSELVTRVSEQLNNGGFISKK